MNMAQINFEEIPNEYRRCTSASCALSDVCLRSIAWKNIPKDQTRVVVLNPAMVIEAKAPIKDGETAECPHFRYSAPQRFAVGFTNMQNQMLVPQYKSFSKLLKDKWGRNKFFYRRNGEYILSPEDQQVVLDTLRAIGVTTPLEFDDYEERINW